MKKFRFGTSSEKNGISSKKFPYWGGGSVIGPILLGSEYPIQIVQMGATVNEITNAAIFSAYDSL